MDRTTGPSYGKTEEAFDDGRNYGPNLERAFAFLHVNEREAKPRNRGLTEIRGPYYSPLGKRYLEDILETMSVYVDSLKFAGGAFSLMPGKAVKELIDLCHAYQVLVSTGGFIEHVLTQGYKAVHRYLHECRELGFDIVEVSSGFIAIPTDDLVRLVEEVQQLGMKAKPEVGVQFGAGGATTLPNSRPRGMRDPGTAIAQARRFLDAGASIIMIESEGITESVTTWRTDIAARLSMLLGSTASCSRPPIRRYSPGTSRITARRSISS